MVDSLVAERLRTGDAREAARAIRHACEHLPPPERADDFGRFFDRFGSRGVLAFPSAFPLGRGVTKTLPSLRSP